jgi:predicted metalloprotease
VSFTRARQLIAFAVLGILLVVKAQQPGPMFAFGASARGFDDDVTVRAAPVPNIYADKPDLRVLQLLSSMNVMWERAFRAAGDDYERPRVETRTQPTIEGCGAAVEGWAGIYCSRGKRIVIDIRDQLVLRAATGDDVSDDLLGYVLAHEVGHHVQALRGRAQAGSADDVLRAELHAQCLAGVWGRAAGRALPPAWSYGVDAEHGSVAQQERWLTRGHARGRPADCDDVWEGAL